MTKQISYAFKLTLLAGFCTVSFAGLAEAAEKMTGRQCRQEWRLHNAIYKQEGKSRRGFMRACRAGTMPLAPSSGAPAARTQ